MAKVPKYFEGLKLPGWKYCKLSNDIEMFTGVEDVTIEYEADDRKPYMVYAGICEEKQFKTIQEAEAWVIKRIEKNLISIGKAVGCTL